MKPCEEIEDIVDRDNLWCGNTDQEPDIEPSFEKIKGEFREYKPGCHIAIRWRSGEIDKGYIFTLPGPDWNDVFMRGFVHIPQPFGGEKGDIEPVWLHLSDLLCIPDVLKVELMFDKCK